jgi:hypothetical protein
MSDLMVRNPVAVKALATAPLAKRPDTLDGQKLGLWWNLKYGGDVALERIGSVFAAKHGVELFRQFVPFPGPKKAIATMAENATVVAGSTGD